MVLFAILLGVGSYDLLYCGMKGGTLWRTPWAPLIAGFTGQPLNPGGGTAGPTTNVPGTPAGSLNYPPGNTPNPNPGVGSNTPIATAPSGQPIYGYIRP